MEGEGVPGKEDGDESGIETDKEDREELPYSDDVILCSEPKRELGLLVCKEEYFIGKLVYACC
jgi:hypothetical protein